LFTPLIIIGLVVVGLFYYVKRNKGSNLFKVFNGKNKKTPIDDTFNNIQMDEK